MVLPIIVSDVILRQVYYLFGKGHAVEIALIGDVQDRIAAKRDFPFRTHSDFDLYGVPLDVEYSESFKLVFGAQETYDPTETKGLHNLPPGLLHNTAEKVDLGGLSVLIPQLELLFLDKSGLSKLLCWFFSYFSLIHSIQSHHFKVLGA